MPAPPASNPPEQAQNPIPRLTLRLTENPTPHPVPPPPREQMPSLLALRRRPGPAATTKTHPEPEPTTTDLIRRRRPRTTFANLPPEIHILISRFLIYPDALSLKHANRYFYQLVDTGVKLKIDWLVERRRLHLECPTSNRGCDLGSDVRFCRGSVRLLMQRRREHIECESRPGLGCLIYGTATCAQSRRLKVRVRRWLRTRVSVELWGVLLALVPLVLGLLVYWLSS